MNADAVQIRSVGPSTFAKASAAAKAMADKSADRSGRVTTECGI
jgi:hypothetical protein